jgi:hypothetical protein
MTSIYEKATDKPWDGLDIVSQTTTTTARIRLLIPINAIAPATSTMLKEMMMSQKQLDLGYSTGFCAAHMPPSAHERCPGLHCACPCHTGTNPAEVDVVRFGLPRRSDETSTP